MNISPWLGRSAVALFSTLITIASAAAESSAFELTQAEAPHLVLGTLVTPQANVLTFADCGKTIDQVRADIAAAATARAREQAEAEARLRAQAEARAAAQRKGTPTVDVVADHALLEEVARVHTEMQEAAREQPSAEVNATADCEISFANFTRLDDGISYREAVHILGCDGTEMSRAAIPGAPTSILYTWTGDAGWGANMNATFQGDSLVSKAQLGLK